MNIRHEKVPVRRRLLVDTVAAVLGVGFLIAGFGADNRARHHGSRDEPAVHNMLIVGKETIFLSHLPMFRAPDSDSPHRYQVILEASLSGPSAQAAYTDDRSRNSATRTYTLNPAEFVLPQLSPGASAPIATFKANVFRGHLEKQGTKLIIKDTDVVVRNIVHFREFDSAAKRLPQLEYILFGKGNELFLAHLITRPPDFDQVLSVTISEHRFSDEELRKGLRVVIKRPNTVSQRLREKQEVLADIRPATGSSQPLSLKLKSVTEHYFEEGELRVPANFDSTAAERRAGFP